MRSITGAILILAGVYAFSLKSQFEIVALILLVLGAIYLFTDRVNFPFRVPEAGRKK